LGTFVITLREGFEAALIVTIVLATLQKSGQLETHRRTVWIGVAAAIAFSSVVGAILFATVGEMEGTAEQAYEAAAMLLAAVVVTWMVFWMQRQAATIGAHLRDQVSASLRVGGGVALASVAFIGVAREGIETALFLFASSEDSGPVLAISLAVAGLVVAVGLGVLVYRGALRLDMRLFFTITGVLVIAFAAYLLFSGLHELWELAGSEALELLAPVVALVYAGGFTALYLRGLIRRRDRQAKPAPASVSA
jgi:high-affinity iron transporter